jgi:hypothetical protein
MKQLTIYLILFLFLQRAAGQSNNIPANGPQFLNHIYYYARADSINELEQNAARMVSKGSGGEFVMEGARSTVRIKTGDSIRFLVKTTMTMMDPSMMIRLYRFIPKKGEREATASSQDESVISYNTMKMADGFILVPASPLAPGEYGFLNIMMMSGAGTRHMSYSIFAFGVD